MRIVLAQPAWSDTHGSFSNMAKLAGLSPPIGIGYLASLAIEGGHDVSILDAEAECYSDRNAAEAILKKNPEIVGLSATTPIFHKAVNIAKHIKKYAPETVTLIGGPHVSVLGIDAFPSCFDIAVRGEADSIFTDLINAVKGGSHSLKVIPGLILRKYGKIIDTGWAPAIQNLDTLPFPAWHLYKPQAYLMPVKGKGLVPYATMTLTRGCPFKCAFCAAGVLEGKKLRSRSPQNIIDEIRFLKTRFGIHHICFNDSTLTLRRDLIEELCALLIDADLKVTWEGWTRANLVDKDLLLLMKKAGFVRISLGIESGSERILKLIRKEVSHNDIRLAYKLVKDVRLDATCSAMMGHPDETEADVWKTVRFIRSIAEIKYSSLSIAVPYPGTELYRMAKNGEHGLKLLTEDYSKYLRYAGGVMEVNGMSPEYLRGLQKKALICMHLTPSKMAGAIHRFGFLPILKPLLTRI